MSWLASLGIAFLSSLLGGSGAIGLGLLCVDWYRIPSREGGSGYFVIFLGLLGLVLGAIMGLVCARIVAAGGSPSGLKGLGVAAGSCVGVLVLATLICRLAADLPTTVRGHPVELHAEIRCPVGFEIPADAKADNWYAHIDTRSRRQTSRTDLPLKAATRVDGRWVISFTLPLETSVREKLLYVVLGGEHHLFIPQFPATPGKKYLTWSNWMEGGWETGKPRPTPEQAFTLRYRLEVETPAEPVQTVSDGPTADQIQAEKLAGGAAEFAALTPQSSLEECLKFTHYSQSEERRQKAGAVIGQRPQVVAEMTAQILSPDAATADRALRAVPFIKPLPAALAQPVQRVGEDVIAKIGRAVAAKPEDDPRYQNAADSSVLFSGWFQAHRALHESAGIDGREQLQKILELARKREDSHVLKDDIARIAEHYLKEWAPAAATVVR